jgi:hypothetical protein
MDPNGCKSTALIEARMFTVLQHTLQIGSLPATSRTAELHV